MSLDHNNHDVNMHKLVHNNHKGGHVVPTQEYYYNYNNNDLSNTAELAVLIGVIMLVFFTCIALICGVCGFLGGYHFRKFSTKRSKDVNYEIENV